MIRKTVFIFIYLISSIAVQAQEVILRDSGIVYPFSGELTYQLTYKGKGFAELKDGLADSMVVIASEKGFAVNFFGGLSDTLLSQVIWYRETNKTIMIYPAINLAWEAEKNSKDTLKGKITRGQKPEKILKKNCKHFLLTYNNKDWKEEFWVWDSLRLYPPGDTLVNNRSFIFYPEIKGILMKFIRKSPEGTLTAVIRTIVPKKEPVLLPDISRYAVDPLPTKSNLKHTIWGN